MGLFTRKKKERVTCPRCMGKGHVDKADIKRLGKELIWIPGSCAYCNGGGIVSKDQLEKIGADASFLTTDLDDQQRKLLINGDAQMRSWARGAEEEVDAFIQEVCFLYRRGNMDAPTIVEFMFLGHDPVAELFREQLELVEKILDQYEKKQG